MRFAHTNLIADDWRCLASFYEVVFNCTPLRPERDLKGGWLDRATGIRDSHIRGVHLALPGYEPGGPTLEIFQYGKNDPTLPPAPNRKGFGHIAFEVDDVAKTLQRLLACGGSPLGEVTSHGVPGAGLLTFAYARDPEGNIVEIQHWEAPG